MDAAGEDWKELRELLRNAALNDWGPSGEPVEWRDSKGKAISAERLKKVLTAVAELVEKTVATEKQIGAHAEMPLRTVQRAMIVLKIKDVLIAEEGRNLRGHKSTSYRILRPKLRLLARDERLPIFRGPRATCESHAPPVIGHAPPVPVAHGSVAVVQGTQSTSQQKWFEAERALRRAGLRVARSIVEEARTRGRITAEELVALAEFYLAHRGAWNPDQDKEPGVIVLAMREWTPGESPTDWAVWPTPRSSYRRERREMAEQQERRERVASTAETVESDSREAAELEAAYGAELDIIATNLTELTELLAQTPQLASEFWRERLRKRGIDSTIRVLLLQTMARNSEGKPLAGRARQ